VFFSPFAIQERYNAVAASPNGFFPADISTSSTTDIILRASLFVLSLFPTAFAILVTNSDEVTGSNLKFSSFTSILYFLDRAFLRLLSCHLGRLRPSHNRKRLEVDLSSVVN